MEEKFEISPYSSDFLWNQQQFDVAERIRLKFPAQYSVTPYEKLRLENVNLEGPNKKDNIATIVDGKVSKALDYLKMVEAERNHTMLKDNNTRALEVFRCRQKFLCSQNKVFSFAKMPSSSSTLLVEQFSDKGPVLENDASFTISTGKKDNKRSKGNPIRSAVIHLTPDDQSWAFLSEFCPSNQQSTYPDEKKRLGKVVKSFKINIPKVIPPPLSCTYVKIKANPYVEDETIYRTVPWLSDQVFLDYSEFSKITGDFINQSLEHSACGEAEELLITHYVENSILPDAKISPSQIQESHLIPAILNSLSNRLGVSKNEILKVYKVISEGAWYRRHIKSNAGHHYDTLQNLISSIDSPGEDTLQPLCGLDEIPFDIDTKENLLAGAGIGLGIINVESYKALVSNYRDFFCRRCYKLNCMDHPISQPQPLKRKNPPPPAITPISKLLLPTDFLRLNRRLPLSNNRTLVDDLVIAKNYSLSEEFSEMEKKKQKIELTDRLKYDKHKKTIYLQNSETSKQQPVLQNCELFQWIHDFSVERTEIYCQPCSLPTNSSNSNVLHSNDFERKNLTPSEPLSVMNFELQQPKFRKQLQVHNPYLSNAAPKHPIITTNISIQHANSPRSQSILPPLQVQERKNSFDEDDEVVFEITKSSKINVPLKNQSNSLLSVDKFTFNEAIRRKVTFQETFDPILSDAEIVIINKLIRIYPFFKNYKHPFTDDIQEKFREYEKICSQSSSSTSNIPYNLLLHDEQNSLTNISLIQFIYDILQTRTMEEIIKILKEKDWLLPEESIENQQSTEMNIVQEEDEEEEEDDDETDDENVIFLSSKLALNTVHNSYQACSHSGSCGYGNKDCFCAKHKTFCDKYCCCDKDCRRKFFGCACKNGQCRTKACPCFAASRVCDPDLCVQCGASIPPIYQTSINQSLDLIDSLPNFPELSKNPESLTSGIDLTMDGSEEGWKFFEEKGVGEDTEEIQYFETTKTAVTSSKDQKLRDKKRKIENISTDLQISSTNKNLSTFKFCCNLPFSLRKPKKLFIKPSPIHGWGAFTLENIEKHEFVIEYKGEIISQDEADRRGFIYDKLNLSYLFNINSELVLDSTRKGNKAKYLNHDKNNPNCITKIVQAECGDHKVGIFALRNIQAGEELTFDYKYKKHVPVWAGGPKKGTKSSAKKHSK